MLEKILSILNPASGKSPAQTRRAQSLSAAQEAELRELFKKDLDAAITRDNELVQRGRRHRSQRSVAA